MKIIIISNRLPVKIVEENNELKLIKSEGGLATGLGSLETKREKHWLGWSGMHITDEGQKADINKQMEELKFHPVYLTPNQIKNYYEGYSNSTIWPLCHYFYSYIGSNNNYWESYKEVNALFCEAALKIIEPGDIVWVQDYQLMLLPAMIREKVKDVSIGYFHHIPFPSYEMFRVLPERAEILRGLLGADLVAFHTYDYMRHFISTVYRVLGYECILDEVQLEDRIVEVDAFPMGINYDLFHDAILRPEVQEKAMELKEGFGDNKIILSVDRLDYSKGILMRLKGFIKFLKHNPEYHGKVSLVMIVVPSRDTVGTYAKLRTRINEFIGGINGKYSTLSWTPVYYFYRAFSFEELTAMYYLADIALVTPLRDGMNLVAKEYIAAKRDKPGVLILSEMAGAVIELSDSIVVNPNNSKEIEDAIVKALEMPEKEQLENLKKLQEIVSTQTVKQWATDFITELKSIKELNNQRFAKVICEGSLDEVKQQYDTASKRLIMLDYDGTLSPFYKDPANAYPREPLLQLLSQIASDSKNHLVINSGRNSATLDEWFGHLNIGLAAEHGVYYKEEGIWHSNLQEINWDEEIVNILKHTTKKTPNSKIEVKNTALVWHYRAVDTWLAELRVNQLIKELINPCSRLNLQIMRGNKVIEVKSSDYNKGIEALRLLKRDSYDFVIAMGDDTTDEDMFAVLPPDSITIKVGRISDAARYNLPSQSLVIPFLKKIAGVE
ncbi:bifunctional alpha,alpha-trehalose-phosphate synthase (UDP-forming)/trehalose-phosphatase [Dysgonomonas macrotermitis]|uniref:Trehalose 6-phosphate synthase /trehalose 6-phosphatase n=1 Tax=Dysgonomonas macrotermitis TaxID=1346286 RepID=A0A1M5DQA2_9BACT|nr:bifunctional alpha,alpha-trehalose-phosphate synthase (UDP-forming)/trehalose-phosphatase [Dysgonomonas macrotermitis]SHF68962.1 trehalose 6-phosphate synthase /trehalose 6-phosphatase [Dysgonomonas macrotermitis]